MVSSVGPSVLSGVLLGFLMTSSEHILMSAVFSTSSVLCALFVSLLYDAPVIFYKLKTHRSTGCG